MPLQSPSVLLLALVCRATAFHCDLSLSKLRAPVPGTAARKHNHQMDGCCFTSTERLKPLSLLQVKAKARRITSAALASASVVATSHGGTGASPAAFRLPLPADETANVSGALSLSVPSRVTNRTLRDPFRQAPLPSTKRDSSVLQRSEVVTLHRLGAATSSEGDAIQGLIFSVICLVIVAGIYCLVVRDYSPGGDFDPTFRPGSTVKRPLIPSSSRSVQHVGQSGQALLPKGQGLPSGPLRDPRASMDRRQEVEEWNAELPMIYPQLVMPVAHTRLAVPIEPLTLPLFEVDVLGLSGVPLLSAALVERSGSRDVHISLHSVSTLIAIITSGMELFGADGTSFFGKMVKDDRADCQKYVLQDRIGRPLLTLTSMQKDGLDFKMTSMSGGRLVERATAVRRPKGKLPAEHFEIVANPNVDAVLVLACFLAVVVFDPAKEMFGSMSRILQTSHSGRSTAVPPRSEAQSLTGVYSGYQQ
mmetsp:Transcript_72593/g.200256  ORF Transcript_72593/g.200256 Transcript_72593/m.200256 type:complete len:476 (+) Transcript_72593:157-1584(+)